MAANSQQGTYLTTTLVGFTAFPAGLVVSHSHAGLGWIVALAGLGLLVFSFSGFVRLKYLEAKK